MCSALDWTRLKRCVFEGGEEGGVACMLKKAILGIGGGEENECSLL